MTVWIETPFDNLPSEGYRKMRYWSMAQAFKTLGHDVVLFASTFNHSTKSPRRIDSENPSFSEGIRLVVVPALPYRRNISFARVRSHLHYANAFEKVAEELVSSGEIKRPSLVVAAVPTICAARSAKHLADKYGAKFVLDVQDAWPETFYRILPRFMRRFGRIFFYPLHRAVAKLYRSADLVTGVSLDYKALSKRDDFYLAPLGVSCQINAERKATQGKIKRLIYAGSLGRGYALETVIEALKLDDELTLEIAGEGEKKNSLKKLAEKSGVLNRVNFHGWIGENELLSLLSQGDAGIIPMRDDSLVALPNKLFDYLAASLPVISSLHGECGEFLQREKSGVLYDIASPSSFIEALHRIQKECVFPVIMPKSFRAEEIYPAYVARLEGLFVSDGQISGQARDLM